MTFRTEYLRSLICAAAAAVWLAGPAACTADNLLGVDTGDPPSDLPIQYSTLSYDASRDQLVVGTNRGVNLFQAADGRKSQSIAVDGGLFRLLARRAGGMLITFDEDNRARIFDDDGNLLRTIVNPNGIGSLDLSPDGRTIMTSFADLLPDGINVRTPYPLVGHVRFVDTGTGAESDFSLPLAAEAPVIYHMVFSPDGSYLAAQYPSTRIWRISDRAVWADIPGGGDGIASVGDGIAFSAAGEIAVRQGAIVDVFAVPSGAKLASYPTGARPLMAYSADGTRLAVTAPDMGIAVNDGVSVIDRVNGADTVELFDDPQTSPPGPRFKVALTFAGPDRIVVAWNDGRLAAFSSSDGARVWSRLDSD
jgi:WD40 repeat protein